ncbi:MAG TPA: N-acetyl-gamma-glutamyl-phosphate reductase, partial [Mobilitalea sp.]|nr:N-acetyl-gamma-glutamyl-phosphate reductase [Mobilitalea sp.]
HKHLKEMMIHTGLTQSPVFLPVVADYYKGLATTISVHTRLLNKKLNGKELHGVLEEHYKGQKFVKVMPYIDEDSLKSDEIKNIIFDGGLDITACNNTNRAEIFVLGNDNRGVAMIITRIDNLGKGASGAAIQNMNLMLGFEEDLNL